MSKYKYHDLHIVCDSMSLRSHSVPIGSPMICPPKLLWKKQYKQAHIPEKHARHGSIKWDAQDEGSWHASSLHKIEPVEFFVKYATIVYDKGELQHDELYLNNKRVILVEARNGIQPYIIYPHPKFTQILHTEDTKDQTVAWSVDSKLQIWSIALPNSDGAASADQRCLYIQDKTNPEGRSIVYVPIMGRC